MIAAGATKLTGFVVGLRVVLGVLAIALALAQSTFDSLDECSCIPDQECNTIVVNDDRRFQHRVSLVVDEVVIGGRLVDAVWTEIDHCRQIRIHALQAHVSRV